jgi:hypothetical protein
VGVRFPPLPQINIMNTTKYTSEILTKAVKASINYSQVVRLVTNKEQVHGSMHKYIKNLIIYYGIDTNHFKGRGSSRGKTNPAGNAYTKSEFIDRFLILNSPQINSHVLKSKLWKFKILPKKCQICNISEWMDRPLTLQIDHINGINTDNRLENLQILCPNCHSQTDTYAGKNNKKGLLKDKKVHLKKIIKSRIKTVKVIKLTKICFCIACKKVFKKKGRKKYCTPKCYHSNKSSPNYKQPTKIKWPPIDEIICSIKKTNYVAYSKILKVSDTAIRKHLKYNNINPKTLLKIT